MKSEMLSAMKRCTFNHAGLEFSYLDSGGCGDALLALHAHWMEAATYSPLAVALAPEWRLVALDQRGHGYSNHAASYTRNDYIEDLSALFRHLGLNRAVLLGNSLGGVNAYQFAARYPSMVRGLIIEDIGTEISVDVEFILNWGGTCRTSDELEEKIGARLLPYLRESFRETSEGWRLAFDPYELQESQRQLNGDHWRDWLASDCPALVIGGRESRVTARTHLESLARRRRNTELKIVPGGHVVHQDCPDSFADAVREFLRNLPRDDRGRTAELQD